MSKTKKTTTEKLQEEMRKISLLPENRTCMDCGVKSTPNVILDFGIFVCSFCAGIHRHFQFKAKGISMTNFTDEQLEAFRHGGNKVAHELWRGKWNESKNPRPKPNEEKLSAFIEDTYVKKRWYGASEQTRVEPITKIISEPEKIQFKEEKKTPEKKVVQEEKKTKEEPFSFFKEETKKPNNTPQKEETLWKTNDDSFETNFEGGFGEPEDFGKTQKKQGLNLDDLFGGSSQQSQQTTQQTNPWQQQQQSNPWQQQQTNPWQTVQTTPQTNPWQQQQQLSQQQYQQQLQQQQYQQQMYQQQLLQQQQYQQQLLQQQQYQQQLQQQQLYQQRLQQQQGQGQQRQQQQQQAPIQKQQEPQKHDPFADLFK